VADRWKSTTWISESMLHRKWLSTYTSFHRLPTKINLKQRASQNSPLDKANPCSAIGRVASQRDVPRFEAASKSRHKCGDKHSESKSA